MRDEVEIIEYAHPPRRRHAVRAAPLARLSAFHMPSTRAGSMASERDARGAARLL
jgi:hypothetical protein